MKNSKLAILAVFLVLALIIGCSGKKDPQKQLEELRTGTEGLTISFLPNNPPAAIYVEPSILNSIEVVLELQNKGVYPQPEEGRAPEGKVFLSGFDKSILRFTSMSTDLNTIALNGKSPINLNGGSDLVAFKGDVLIENLNVEKYEPTLLATACYRYKTVAGPSVCIDPDPYSTIKQKKVCEASDIALASQGAPIAVVKIDTEAFAQKTQFKITIKNVGSGTAIKAGLSNAFEKCNPFGNEKLAREDIDKVYLEGVRIGQQFLQCWPFSGEKDEPTRTISDVKSEKGYIRLLNGEGSILCELLKTDFGYEGGATAYTTPMKVELSYVYKTTAERKVAIKKENVVT